MELLHGVRDEPATRALIAQENRRYARRQLIWFRKEPNLSWFDGPGESPEVHAPAWLDALAATARRDGLMAAHSETRRSRRPAEHSGRLPQLRAARAARRHHPAAWTGESSRGASRTSIASRSSSRSSGADHMLFKHAIATISTPRAGRQLLLARSMPGARSGPEHGPCQRPSFRRVIVLVLDSVGIGELPDAARYGDEGSDTLGNICRTRSAAHADAAVAGPRQHRPLRGVPPAAGAARRRSAAWRRRRPARTR